MSGERLLASYIVRITVRDGERSIHLHDVGSGGTLRLGSYVDLLDHLGRREEALDRPGPPTSKEDPMT